MPGKMHSFPSSRTTGYVLSQYFYWRALIGVRTTQTSLSTKITSACSGKSAMRRVAARCWASWVPTHLRYLFISDMRRIVSS
jgi:hypothetical protein